ncbi:MAG: hypothetical protein ACREK4_18160, partial [Candidatus Rokuibacteriota bacterium]
MTLELPRRTSIAADGFAAAEWDVRRTGGKSWGHSGCNGLGDGKIRGYPGEIVIGMNSREEGAAPLDAGEESSGLRLEEVEYGLALCHARPVRRLP